MLNKSNIAFFCILGMIAGFLLNNIVLSIFTMLFCGNLLWDVDPRQWFKNKYWLLGVAWLAIVAISWFWSDDKVHWDRTFQVKLPVLLFPLVFPYLPSFTARRLQLLTLLMSITLFIGVCYSLSFLIIDPETYINQYRYSHLLPTPCSQDHVRFSMALTFFFIFSVAAWPRFTDRRLKWVLGCILAIMIIYLHILAAKSGLISLYLFLISWGIYLAFHRQKKIGIAIIISIPLLLLLATTYIRTFRERIDYMGYAWDMLIEGDRSGNYGDIGRLMSYKLSFELIKEHPMAGVGAGDMYNQMNNGYEKYYPQVDKKARLIPHNQFLIIALGCGIPAMLLFMAWVIYPLTTIRRNRHGFFIAIVWLLLLFQLMIEPILEVQNGVFVFLFFLLWQQRPLPENEPAT